MKPIWTLPRGLDGKTGEVSLAILNPLFLHQPLPFVKIQPVNQFDRALANSGHSTDIPQRLGFAQKVTSEVDRATGDGYRTPPVCNAVFPRFDNDIGTYGLHVRRQIEVVAVSSKHVFGTRRRGGGRGGCRGSWSEIERLLEGFVALPKDLLRHMRQVAYFSERPRDVGLSACDEDAGSNDRVQGFPSQQLFLVGALVQLFRDVADSFRKRELITPAGNIAERGKKVALGAGALCS